MRQLTVCLTAITAAGLGAWMPAAQARYDSNARRLCAAERIQMGARGFSRRYGGRGAMRRCLHSNHAAHQAYSNS